MRAVTITPDAVHATAAAFHASQPAPGVYPEATGGDVASAVVLAATVDWAESHTQMCAYREESATRILGAAGVDGTALPEADADNAALVNSIQEV